MNFNHFSESEFIERLTMFIVANLEDESLSVQDIAQEYGISVHAINQKLFAVKKKHLNQFIRELRLQKAFELLQDSRYTAAEVAYKVGFSSPAYFNKCFHIYYGCPPGKVKISHGSGNTQTALIAIPVEKEGMIKPKGTRRFIWLSLTILIVAIIGLLFKSFLWYRDRDTQSFYSKENKVISIAVMPFRNLTNDSNWDIWEEGIQSCLVNILSNSGMMVLQSEVSINNIIKSENITDYAALKPELAGKVSRKLGAGVFICGNITKSGRLVRLNAQLIDSYNEESFSSFHMDGSDDSILNLIDSMSVLINNALIMFEFRDLRPAEIQNYKNYSTRSTEAYSNYIYGNLAFYKNDFPAAIDWYLQALDKDSTFFLPMSKIALAYYNESKFEEGKVWCRKHYSMRNRMNLKQRISANALYAVFFGNYYDRIKYLRQLLELDEQNPMTWFNIGDSYFEMMEYEKAIPEFEYALELFDKFDMKPYWGAYYYELGISYHKTGQFKKEKRLYRRADIDFPNDPGLLDQHAWLELSLGNINQANQYLSQWTSVRREEGWPEARIASYMAYIYSMAEMIDKQEEYLRKSLALEPTAASCLNNLAYFLIDGNLNINEGMVLVKKALQLYPDNYKSMHILGLALYKKGNYQEAFDLMQKSWELRMQKSIYHHTTFLQLEEAKKAVTRYYN